MTLKCEEIGVISHNPQGYPLEFLEKLEISTTNFRHMNDLRFNKTKPWQFCKY